MSPTVRCPFDGAVLARLRGDSMEWTQQIPMSAPLDSPLFPVAAADGTVWCACPKCGRRFDSGRVRSLLRRLRREGRSTTKAAASDTVYPVTE